MALETTQRSKWEAFSKSKTLIALRVFDVFVSLKNMIDWEFLQIGGDCKGFFHQMHIIYHTLWIQGSAALNARKGYILGAKVSS